MLKIIGFRFSFALLNKYCGDAVRFVVFFLSLMLSFSAALAQSPMDKIMFLTGSCVQLILGDEDLSAECEPKLMHTAVNTENIDFNFTTSDNRLFVFNGSDGDNPSPNTDFTLLRTVAITANGKSTDFPASGRCSYGNPYAGRTTISCLGKLKEGRRFEATFLTDGKMPATGANAADQMTLASPSSVQSETDKPAPIQSNNIQQGYVTKTDFGKVKTLQLESIEAFNLTVCNRTGHKIVMAFHTKYNNLLIDEDFAVHGWYTAPAQKCTDLGAFTPTEFAFYANNENGREWTGKDYSLCVEKERFKHIVYKDTKCPMPLRKGFTALEIDSSEYTLNLR